jgi:hypothetical protein
MICWHDKIPQVREIFAAKLHKGQSKEFQTTGVHHSTWCHAMSLQAKSQIVSTWYLIQINEENT